MTKKVIKKENPTKVKGNTVTVSQIKADKITQVSLNPESFISVTKSGQLLKYS